MMDNQSLWLDATKWGKYVHRPKSTSIFSPLNRVIVKEEHSFVSTFLIRLVVMLLTVIKLQKNNNSDNYVPQGVQTVQQQAQDR
jgi:hypothetical protein